jgi:hypothetical protein
MGIYLMGKQDKLGVRASKTNCKNREGTLGQVYGNIFNGETRQTGGEGLKNKL